jgi:hypothetical protein
LDGFRPTANPFRMIEKYSCLISAPGYMFQS